MTQTILSAKPVYCKMLLNGHYHYSTSTGRDVPFRGFDRYDEVRTARRRLPHWRQPGVSYFVTFRLTDSVPQPVLRQWRHERAIWLRLHPQPWGVDEQREYEARFIGRTQECRLGCLSHAEA